MTCGDKQRALLIAWILGFNTGLRYRRCRTIHSPKFFSPGKDNMSRTLHIILSLDNLLTSTKNQMSRGYNLAFWGVDWLCSATNRSTSSNLPNQVNSWNGSVSSHSSPLLRSQAYTQPGGRRHSDRSSGDDPPLWRQWWIKAGFCWALSLWNVSQFKIPRNCKCGSGNQDESLATKLTSSPWNCFHSRWQGLRIVIHGRETPSDKNQAATQELRVGRKLAITIHKTQTWELDNYFQLP